MNKPAQSQWETRCAFESFCKRAICFEASNARRDLANRQKKAVLFSELTPQELKSLYSEDTYFASEETDDSIRIAGKRITPELLAEALRSLPEEKKTAVLLYYFMDMSDKEIGKLFNIPRSTVQYRRTSSFEQLRKYLEENAYDDDNE
jgi:RNA polymerase sigma factor, sigma-70 family